MKVFVYRNLRSKNWSVKALQGPCKGKVIAHASTVALRGTVQFKVSEAGRQRVLRDQRKNVHAGVVGLCDLAGVQAFPAYWTDLARRVYYNPYISGSFSVQTQRREMADVGTYWQSVVEGFGAFFNATGQMFSVVGKDMEEEVIENAAL